MSRSVRSDQEVVQFPVEVCEGVFPTTKVECLGQIADKILVEIDDFLILLHVDFATFGLTTVILAQPGKAGNGCTPSLLI